MLTEVYPEIGLDETRLPRIRMKVTFCDCGLIYDADEYWKDTANQRAFFDKVAKETGFDPLNPENWYQYDLSSLYAKKVVCGITKHYDNSH